MSIDYSSLRDKMKEKGVNQKELAERIGVSESHLCKKLSGEYALKQTEILKVCEALEIPAQEISVYFFTEKVENTQQTA